MSSEFGRIKREDISEIIEGICKLPARERTALKRCCGKLLKDADAGATMAFYQVYSLPANLDWTKDRLFTVACMRCMWDVLGEEEKTVPIEKVLYKKRRELEEKDSGGWSGMERRLLRLLDRKWDRDGILCTDLWRMVKQMKMKVISLIWCHLDGIYVIGMPKAERCSSTGCRYVIRKKRRKRKMLIEIHMLKNYPPTNLNRDDLGSPKTCVFGGSNRSRISSQCLKRSWRKSEIFADTVGAEYLGTRTRKFPVLVKDKLVEMGVLLEYAEAIMPQMSAIGNKDAKENKKDVTKTAQIAIYSMQDIEDIANVAKAELDQCKNVSDVKKIKVKDIAEKIKNAKVRPISVDIALFGRMVTSDMFRDVEASVQVAHALSTNRVIMESDYFVAMDDLVSGKSLEDAGAGMIDSTEFNSSCYYIYASVDTDILAENLAGVEDVPGLAKKAVEGMLNAMAFSDPSGKQHAFAGHILPSFTLVECKDKKIPVSYTNAFVEAINPNEDGGLIQNSIEKLLQERQIIRKDYAVPVKESFVFCSSRYSDKVDLQNFLTVCGSYEEIIQNVISLLP